MSLAVYDLLGRAVMTTPTTTQAAGEQDVTLGGDLTPGVYLYRLTVDGANGRQEVSGRFVRVH